MLHGSLFSFEFKDKDENKDETLFTDQDAMEDEYLQSLKDSPSGERILDNSFIVQNTDLVQAFPQPTIFDHKYSRGVVSLTAGTDKYPGAGVLCAGGSLGTGTGLVRLRAKKSVENLVLSYFPEVVLAQGPCDAYVIGPGHDPADPDHCRAMLQSWKDRSCVEGKLPLAVLDAGALFLVGDQIHPDEQSLLTPHAGEAAALAQRAGFSVKARQVSEHPDIWARKLAKTFGCAVLVKGSMTVVADSCGKLFASGPAPATLATAGSGDVLAGVIAALGAQNAAHHSYFPKTQQETVKKEKESVKNQNMHPEDAHQAHDETVGYDPEKPLEPALLGALGALLHAQAARSLPCTLRAFQLCDALADAWQSVRMS